MKGTDFIKCRMCGQTFASKIIFKNMVQHVLFCPHCKFYIGCGKK